MKTVPRKNIPFIYLWGILASIIWAMLLIGTQYRVWNTPKKISSHLVYSLPSNPSIFTEWLFFENGHYYISSWNPSNFPWIKSLVAELDTNANIKKVFYPDEREYFGEGITKIEEKIFFLSWQHHKWYILNANNFEKIREFSFTNVEWWGLADDENNLYMSDGTENITVYNQDFKRTSTIRVTENHHPITNLNELEYIEWILFANIWLTNDIIAIDIHTGNVIWRYNFDAVVALEKSQNPQAQELNGIAFNPETYEITITGKLWKHLYILPKKLLQ